MVIGVPREIKNNEYRVGLTPESVAEFVAHGHDVQVETGAGLGIQFLKHLSRTRLLLHILDIAPFDDSNPVDDAKKILADFLFSIERQFLACMDRRFDPI